MQRHNALMLLTGMMLFVCALAFGQTAAPVASIPDLSGIWGRNWFFFEPPLSGPGPVASKLRRPNGTLIAIPMVGDYNNGILRPPAVAAVKKRGEMELSGVVPPNPGNQCWPEPTPYTLNHQQGVQIIQQKDQVILIYLRDHKVRHVRMNVPHSEHPTPTWQGESIGHYEGDTLVIDTIGQKIGPLSMVDLYGTPFSPALHVIERYRLIDGATAPDLQLTHESAYFGASDGGVPREMGCVRNGTLRLARSARPPLPAGPGRGRALAWESPPSPCLDPAGYKPAVGDGRTRFGCPRPGRSEEFMSA